MSLSRNHNLTEDNEELVEKVRKGQVQDYVTSKWFAVVHLTVLHLCSLPVARYLTLLMLIRNLLLNEKQDIITFMVA